MSRRITNSEIRSEQDLIDLGADKTYLPHASKIYVDKIGIEKRLDEYLVKNNFLSNRDPDEFDDSTKNFEVGSTWINNTEGFVFTCISSNSNNAVWFKVGSHSTPIKEIIPITQSIINDGFLDLQNLAKDQTLQVYAVGGLPYTDTFEYTSSTINNITRLTFAADILSSITILDTLVARYSF